VILPPLVSPDHTIHLALAKINFKSQRVVFTTLYLLSNLETSQTGGQRYSDTSPFSIPGPNLRLESFKGLHSGKLHGPYTQPFIFLLTH